MKDDNTAQWKKYIPAIIILLVGIGLYAFSTMDKDILEGAVMDFTLNNLEGQPVSLSNYRGKVVVIDFWATWCPPCRKGLPSLQKLYEEYKGKGVTVIGISLDNSGPAAVKQFIQQRKITFPIVMADQKVQHDFGGIPSIPTTFILDKDGKVVQKYRGLTSESNLEKVIHQLL